jgi:hypothetical protein
VVISIAAPVPSTCRLEIVMGFLRSLGVAKDLRPVDVAIIARRAVLKLSGNHLGARHDLAVTCPLDRHSTAEIRSVLLKGLSLNHIETHRLVLLPLWRTHCRHHALQTSKGNKDEHPRT